MSSPAAAAARHDVYPRLAIDAVEQVELALDRGRGSVGGRQDADVVALPDDALDEDPGVHPRIGWVEQDRDPAGLAPDEDVLDDVAGVGGRRQLEEHLVADREPRPDRQEGQLDATRRQVLADGARLDRVSVGLDPLDRLDGEQADGAMRPAVDVVVVVGVAVEAHAARSVPPPRGASGRRRARC